MNFVQETKPSVSAQATTTVKLTEVNKGHKGLDIVDQYPATLQIFLDFGFSQMANPVMRNTMGRVATIDMATKMHNVDLDTFLTGLMIKLVKKVIPFMSSLTEEKKLYHGQRYSPRRFYYPHEPWMTSLFCGW